MMIERDYALQARAILEKQHARVRDAARALMQHIEFIRPCDVDPQEREALAFVRAFLAGDAARKPVERELGASVVVEERRRA